MKRKRKSSLIELKTKWWAKPYFGEVIPPRSVVKLMAPWGEHRGRIFRIGYYSRQDGLDCVWLVNEKGEYEQTTDQDSINTEFQILAKSDDSDLFGFNREVLGPASTEELVKLERA